MRRLRGSGSESEVMSCELCPNSVARTLCSLCSLCSLFRVALLLHPLQPPPFFGKWESWSGNSDLQSCVLRGREQLQSTPQGGRQKLKH